MKKIGRNPKWYHDWCEKKPEKELKQKWKIQTNKNGKWKQTKMKTNINRTKQKWKQTKIGGESPIKNKNKSPNRNG